MAPPPWGARPCAARAGRRVLSTEKLLGESFPPAKSCARPHRALFETTHRRRDAQFLACRSSRVEQIVLCSTGS